FAVEHVGENGSRIALQRIAVSAPAGDVLPELIAGMKDDHLLRRQLFAGAVRPHDVRVGAGAGAAALETPRRRSEALAAMRDHHVGRRGFENFFEPETAAEAPGAARVDPQAAEAEAQ